MSWAHSSMCQTGIACLVCVPSINSYRPYSLIHLQWCDSSLINGEKSSSQTYFFYRCIKRSKVVVMSKNYKQMWAWENAHYTDRDHSMLEESHEQTVADTWYPWVFCVEYCSYMILQNMCSWYFTINAQADSISTCNHYGVIWESLLRLMSSFLRLARNVVCERRRKPHFWKDGGQGWQGLWVPNFNLV